MFFIPRLSRAPCAAGSVRAGSRQRHGKKAQDIRQRVAGPALAGDAIVPYDSGCHTPGRGYGGQAQILADLRSHRVEGFDTVQARQLQRTLQCHQYNQGARRRTAIEVE